MEGLSCPIEAEVAGCQAGKQLGAEADVKPYPTGTGGGRCGNLILPILRDVSLPQHPLRGTPTPPTALDEAELANRTSCTFTHI